MPSAQTQQPISGYTGYQPGSKWQVGGKNTAVASTATGMENTMRSAYDSTARSIQQAGSQLGNAVQGEYNRTRTHFVDGATDLQGGPYHNQVQQQFEERQQFLQDEARRFPQNFGYANGGGANAYSATQVSRSTGARGGGGGGVAAGADGAGTYHFSSSTLASGDRKSRHSNGLPAPYPDYERMSGIIRNPQADEALATRIGDGGSFAASSVRLNDSLGRGSRLPEEYHGTTRYNRANFVDGPTDLQGGPYHNQVQQQFEQRQQFLQDEARRFPQNFGYAGGGGNMGYARTEITEATTQGGGGGRSGVEERRRAQSLPRKPKAIEKDPFEGLEGGWWSKGEVARNKERRELAKRGIPIGSANGQGGLNTTFQYPPAPTGRSAGGGGGGGGSEASGYTGNDKELKEEDEEERVPAAGYSGHIPAELQRGGSSVTMASANGGFAPQQGGVGYDQQGYGGYQQGVGGGGGGMIGGGGGIVSGGGVGEVRQGYNVPYGQPMPMNNHYMGQPPQFNQQFSQSTMPYPQTTVYYPGSGSQMGYPVNEYQPQRTFPNSQSMPFRQNYEGPRPPY